MEEASTTDRNQSRLLWRCDCYFEKSVLVSDNQYDSSMERLETDPTINTIFIVIYDSTSLLWDYTAVLKQISTRTQLRGLG